MGQMEDAINKELESAGIKQEGLAKKICQAARDHAETPKKRSGPSGWKAWTEKKQCIRNAHNNRDIATQDLPILE